MDRFGCNLGGRILSRSRHVRHDAGNGRCLATAHWTFSSYGRLEAERMHQFWWNLVYNSKLGPKWQSRDQILNFLKFEMAARRDVWIYWKCHNSPTNELIGTKLGWSHSITFPTCPPWCGCHGNDRCLATAHWTFSSYGRLRAELVNQFWWNFVHNSKLGRQWQSRDQTSKFYKFKMADGRHVGKYWNCQNSPPKTDWDETCTSHHVSDMSAMMQLSWQQLRASGDQTHEPILMKFGTPQQIKISIPVTWSDIKIL